MTPSPGTDCLQDVLYYTEQMCSDVPPFLGVGGRRPNVLDQVENGLNILQNGLVARFSSENLDYFNYSLGYLHEFSIK